MRKRPFSLHEEPRHISGLLRDWLSHEKAGQEILSKMVRRTWEKVMGPMVSRLTGAITMNETVLTIEILSPVLRTELIAMRSDIMMKLNEELGEGAVTRLVLR
jgi:predicted nucleic acid-binding Zn ribbon protein